MKRYAVVTARDRIGALRVCLEAICPQVDTVFLVDNSDDGMLQPKVIELGGAGNIANLLTIADPQQPPNLSQLWNLGLKAAYTAAAVVEAVGHYVAVLNDDAIVPPGWFSHLQSQMESAGCAAGGYGGSFAVHRAPGTTRLDQRMPGHAFILDGRYGLRADERLRWWCGDNDLDMQARRVGGTLILEGDPVKHLFPDQSTITRPELSAMTGEDMRRFVEKWGFRPW